MNRNKRKRPVIIVGGNSPDEQAVIKRIDKEIPRGPILLRRNDIMVRAKQVGMFEYASPASSLFN